MTQSTTEEGLLDQLKAGTYLPHGGTIGGDMSNTQFAALALWAARRHDVPVDPALRAAASTIRKAQAPAGTWGYGITDGGHRDSGTCGGLILLALGRVIETPDDNNKKALIEDPAVVAGLAHLGKVLHKDFNGRVPAKGKGKATGKPIGAEAHGDLYFLWALERMSLILNIEKITDVNWHAWGSEIILANQLPDGSWKDAFGFADTCFALLFLRQANLFQDLTDKLQGFEAPSRTGSAAPARRDE